MIIANNDITLPDTNLSNIKEYNHLDIELTPSILEEIRFREETELNRHLDEVLQRNPNRFPPSVFFIIANEFGERFCYNGIKPLIFIFLQKYLNASKAFAKSQFHLWVSLTNLFPIVGAAFSDSYFGKYNTIIVMSVIYLLGTYSLSIFSIKDLLWSSSEGTPVWPVIISLHLIGIGAGGIKPCVASHGGDQFPPSHYHLLNKFFQCFFWAINIGSLLAGMLTPLIKDYYSCFGNKCYFLSFGICALVFTITLAVFVFGSTHYRVVPPPGEFLPLKALKGAWKARSLWRKASPESREFHGHWLNFADDFVGAHFTEEIRLLGKVMVMFSPFIFFYILYDQFTSEWQNQVEKMDTHLIGGHFLSIEMSSYINTLLIVFFIPILNYLVYPFLQKRGWNFRLLDRMAVGYFFVILAFIASSVLEIIIHNNNIKFGRNSFPEDGETSQCVNCLSWTWQFPQWILLSIGEALLSPSGLEFAYSQVGPQMKASSASIWLLSGAIGNAIVSILETIFEGLSHGTRLWMYVGLSSVGFFLLLFLKYFYYVYKEDEMEIYDDEETFSVSCTDPTE